MSAEVEDSSTSLNSADVSLAEQEVNSSIESIEEASLPGATEGATSYWELSKMAPLNEISAPTQSFTPEMNTLLIRSKAAVARLRAYKPPDFPLWDRLPVSRRAAVLLLLYADRHGDLRVVITMRATTLRSFSGHAALPGGKADSIQESPYQIARREAWEEIGLPEDDAKIPAPFRIEPLCSLPFNLARTELVVRPCVALLHSDDPAASSGLSPSPSVEESLIPRLNAREVAAVFSAPFHNFLRAADEPALQRGRGTLPPGHWYEGSWTRWHDTAWRLHYFYVPVNDQHVSRPRPRRDSGLAALSEHPEAETETEDEDKAADERFMVWGMTARILVDAARVAYAEQPEFEHNAHSGDEGLIETLDKLGRLNEKKRSGSHSTGTEAKEESKM